MAHNFPTPSAAEWRVLAEKALKDRAVESLVHLDVDGLAVRPLYAAATGVDPVYAPRSSQAEGRAWDLRSLIEEPDPLEANAAIRAELEGGAASIILGGPVASDAEGVARALDGIALEIAPIGLEAGLFGPVAAEALASAAKGAPRSRLMFHMDPVSAFAISGCSPSPVADHLSEAAATAAQQSQAYPEATFFLASGRPVHEAGGSPVQELAFAAANAVSLIRAGLKAGLDPEQALRGTVIGLSLDQAYFDSLAKLRAMRLIWRSIAKAFGSEAPALIEARSSRRMLSARDPWPNLLRLTAACFAGATGGAEAVTLDGFSRANGRPDAFALRQARNTQLVLMEEAHVARVEDPAAGSWYLDHRTRELAEAAWSEFQAIEAEGGLVEALRGGVIQARVARSRRALEEALRSGSTHLVGVTKFVDPDPLPVSVESLAPAPVLRGGDECQPLAPVRLAAAHELQGEA